MRIMLLVGSLLVVVVPVTGQEKLGQLPRFGVPAEPEVFPQDAPKRLLSSLQKAFERKRMDYLLAHLLDPVFSERQMDHYYRQRFGKTRDEDRELSREERDRRERAALDLFVAEVNDHLALEPKQTLFFFRLLKEGMVEESGTSATVRLPANDSVSLTLRQIEGRWYMLNDRTAGTTTAPAKP
jgi:hypothetical protein